MKAVTAFSKHVQRLVSDSGTSAAAAELRQTTDNIDALIADIFIPLTSPATEGDAEPLAW